jgi:alkylhydroperoxidase family enzyme
VAGSSPRRRRASDDQALIAELAAATIEGVRLARALMAAQEVADDLERAAAYAVDDAASHPDDAGAADVAVATVSAASEAGEAELAASIDWAGHVARVQCLIDAVHLCEAPGRPVSPAS